jgi:uncharacterized protein DUF5990
LVATYGVAMDEVHFRIVGTDLPGASCGPSPTPSGTYENIHVGLQRKQEPVDLVRADAKQAVFEFDATIRNGRFSSPHIHGKGDERFIYLTWGELVGTEFRMFRRAKLQLDSLDPAEAAGRTITGTLSLTDAKGHPTCASVRPPAITWHVT